MPGLLVRSSIVLAAVVFGAPGCRSPEARACSEQYETAQKLVQGVDAKSHDSVAAALASVEAALKTCRDAQRLDFVDELTKGKNELSAQLQLLDRRAARTPRRQPTPEERSRFEKDGDPSCPRGQAYRPEGGKEIRCTGPQLIEMNAQQAREHFDERGYRVRSVAPATLEIERGSERTTLIFPGSSAAAPPDCVILFPVPGMPWAEALSRATGVKPSKLKLGSNVETARGPLPFSVDEKNVVIRVGRCPEPSAR